MKIALVHDIAEALVGDITPPESSGISENTKHALEEEAFKKIASYLLLDQNNTDDSNEENTKLGKELQSYYQEYMDQKTKEGQLCKQFDKLEMIIQAYEYESSQGVVLDTFYKSTMNSFKHPYLQQVHAELLKRRQALLDSREQSKD